MQTYNWIKNTASITSKALKKNSPKRVIFPVIIYHRQSTRQIYSFSYLSKDISANSELNQIILAYEEQMSKVLKDSSPKKYN